MSYEQCHPMGKILDTKLGVQHQLDNQHVLIEHSEFGQRLVHLLAGHGVETVELDGLRFRRIHHDYQVDRLLMELTDLFISIRYTHPTLVQLELALDKD